MNITFWGVRGSVPVASDRTVRTGGNTTCVVVEHQGHHLVLDGGTGLRAFGASLGFQPLKATLLFTHVHWDHIQGVPFFAPAFHPGSMLTFAGAARDSGRLSSIAASPPLPLGPAPPAASAAAGGGVASSETGRASRPAGLHSKSGPKLKVTVAALKREAAG